MKECEKWLGENLCAIPGRVATLERKYDFRQGWKQALEWALTQKIQSTEEMLIDEVAIKKELGE